MGFKTTALIATASVLFASSPAFAAKFTFSGADLGQNENVGFNKAITTSYNGSDLFEWSATFKDNGGALADGAWLVVNGGGNPKQSKDKLAIFYMDGGEDKKVSIFEYNGKNNSDSLGEAYLGSTDLVVSELGDERTFSFKLDMTDINSRTDLGQNWKGAQFTDRVGIWHHGVDGLKTDYDENGKLVKFEYDEQGWYDIGSKPTTAVPEPATAVSLGLFAATAAFIKRKQSA